jgi:cell division cycle 2-like protein
MASKSRWADEDPETEAIIAQRKREKEEKRRAKAEKQRQLEAQQQQQQQQQKQQDIAANGDSEAPPKKRRRLSNDQSIEEPPAVEPQDVTPAPRRLLRFPVHEWGPCRHVDNFERLNHIEEGSYGWVSRAKDITTGEVVALKKLKMENSPDGFPVTGLREIQTLLEARHSNIVFLREIVMGNKMDEYVEILFLRQSMRPHPFVTFLSPS